MRVDVLLFQALGSEEAECPACGKTFRGSNRRQKVARHVLTHTGLRPFCCIHCPYRATQKAHIKRHLQRRHGKSGQSLRFCLSSCTIEPLRGPEYSSVKEPPDEDSN